MSTRFVPNDPRAPGRLHPRPRHAPARCRGGASAAAVVLLGLLAGVASAAPPKLPPGDPCTVLPLAEVQKVFPGARAGERSRRLEAYGSTDCAWKDGHGSVVLEVQESYGVHSAREEAQGMALGFLDPVNPAAARNVRYESFSGMGSDAVAFVEKADPKRGIVGDGALLIVHRGERMVALGSPTLPARERGAALKAFEALGRVAARRLD